MALAISSPAFADVPRTIYYEGRLKDASGNFLHGNFYVEFTIYDGAVDGHVLWREVHSEIENSSVFVDSGLFSVVLGSINPMPDSVVKNHGRWLGIRVGSEPEITPRTPLLKGAYSYKITDRGVASTEKADRKPCNWHDRGLPNRRRFPITEWGLYKLATSSVASRYTICVAIDVGYVWNLTKNTGLGGTVHVATDEGEDTRIGPKLRYRRWLNDDFALDISSGVTWNILRRNVKKNVRGKLGYASSIGLNYRDKAVFCIKYDIFPTWYRTTSAHAGSVKTQRALYAGFTVGSKPGLAMIGVSFACVLLLVVASHIEIM